MLNRKLTIGEVKRDHNNDVYLGWYDGSMLKLTGMTRTQIQGRINQVSHTIDVSNKMMNALSTAKASLDALAMVEERKAK